MTTTTATYATSTETPFAPVTFQVTAYTSATMRTMDIGTVEYFGEGVFDSAEVYDENGNPAERIASLGSGGTILIATRVK